MNKIMKYIIAISIMLITSVISLLVLSILTYLFKWQADIATIGIIITYVLAGLSGGFILRKIEKKSLWKTVLDTLIASVLFLVLLRVVSFVVKP